MINKYYISERYLLDRDSGMLHDLKGDAAPDNKQCRLNDIAHPLLFDSRKLPVLDKPVKIKTAGGKRTFIIREYCPHCLPT